MGGWRWAWGAAAIVLAGHLCAGVSGAEMNESVLSAPAVEPDGPAAGGASGVWDLFGGSGSRVKGFFLARGGYAYDESELPFLFGLGGYVDGTHGFGASKVRLSLLGEYRNEISAELRIQRFNADLWHAYYETILGDHALTLGRQVLEMESGWKVVEFSLIEQANPMNLRDFGQHERFMKVPIEMIAWRYKGQKAYLSYWRPSPLAGISESSGLVRSPLSFAGENVSGDLNDLVRYPEFPIQMGYRGGIEIAGMELFPSGQVLLESVPLPELEEGLRRTPGTGLDKIGNISETEIGESVAATQSLPIVLEPAHYFLVGMGARGSLFDRAYLLSGEVAYAPSRRLLDEDWEIGRSQMFTAAVQVERTIRKLVVLNEVIFASVDGKSDWIGLDRRNWANVLAFQYFHGDHWRPRLVTVYVHGEGAIVMPRIEYEKSLIGEDELQGGRIRTLTLRLEGAIVRGSPLLGWGQAGEILPFLEPTSSVRLSVQYDL